METPREKRSVIFKSVVKVLEYTHIQFVPSICMFQNVKILNIQISCIIPNEWGAQVWFQWIFHNKLTIDILHVVINTI